MFAPGTTALVESATVPVIVPRSVCANAADATRIATIATRRIRTKTSLTGISILDFRSWEYTVPEISPRQAYCRLEPLSRTVIHAGFLAPPGEKGFLSER